MPVTAKLSRRFYETFGDEIANELVGWFNSVDDAYRSEFRELFEVNFARFDAKLEQRLAEAKAELRTEMHAGFAQLRGETATGLGTLRSELASGRSELLKWMFVYWAGSVVTTVGLVLAVVGLLKP